MNLTFLQGQQQPRVAFEISRGGLHGTRRDAAGQTPHPLRPGDRAGASERRSPKHLGRGIRKNQLGSHKILGGFPWVVLSGPGTVAHPAHFSGLVAVLVVKQFGYFLGSIYAGIVGSEPLAEIRFGNLHPKKLPLREITP